VKWNVGSCRESGDHSITKRSGDKLSVKHACAGCGGPHSWTSCPSR
jgi:hypothetical protein